MGRDDDGRIVKRRCGHGAKTSRGAQRGKLTGPARLREVRVCSPNGVGQGIQRSSARFARLHGKPFKQGRRSQGCAKLVSVAILLASAGSSATAVSRAVAPRRWIACGFRAQTAPTARVPRVEFFPSHTDLSHALKSWRAITSSRRSPTAAGRPDSKSIKQGPKCIGARRATENHLFTTQLHD